MTTISPAPPPNLSASCSQIKTESKTSQPDTGKQAIPGHMRWHQLNTMWHIFNSTAPEDTCDWLQYTPRTSGPQSVSQRSPRPSGWQWVLLEEKLGSIKKMLVQDSCNLDEPWHSCSPDLTQTQSGLWGGGTAISCCTNSTQPPYMGIIGRLDGQKVRGGQPGIG